RTSLLRIVLWWSVFTALTGTIYPSPDSLVPFGLLLTIRFLFGVGEAGAYPNIARAFHNWFPFGERGSAQGAVWMAGRFAGGITPLLVTALFFPVVVHGSATVFWRHIFWVFGLLGLVWCGLFWWWFRDRPEQKPGVNAAELALISDKGEGAAKHAEESHLNVPWGKLLASGNLWILCAMYFC